MEKNTLLSSEEVTSGVRIEACAQKLLEIKVVKASIIVIAGA